MTPKQFTQWFGLLSEGVLLTAKDGRILAANHAVRQLGLLPEDLIGKTLAELTSTPENEIRDFLTRCSRSRQPILSALTLSTSDTTSLECRCDGMLAQHDPDGEQSTLLIKLTPRESSVREYKLINQKIEELNQEIQRRRLAEEALSRQNEYLEVTLTSIGDGVIVTDAEGKITLLNPVAEALTGWSNAEALGVSLETVFRIVNESTRESVENPAIRALREGLIVGLANHTLLLGKNGSEHAIDDSAAPIRDSEGNLLGAVAVFRDITERRQTEASLWEQELLLQTITNNMPSMLFMMDSKGKATYMNETVTTLTGYSRVDLIGEVLHDKIHSHPGTPHDPIEDCPLNQVLSLQKPVRGHEDIFIRKNGESFPVRCSATPIIRYEVPVGTVIEVQDITAERENIKKLEMSEARFTQLADAIPQLAWMAGPDGYIDWYNNRWYEYTGTTYDQMKGWGWQRVHDPKVLPEVMEKWKSSISSGTPFSMVFPLRGADGEFRPFLTRIMPFRNEQGEVVRWFGTNTDISEQVTLQEELRRIAAKLSEADRRKDEFLATLAHELRNPLSPIRTGLEIMKMSKDDPETMEEIRSTMERQAKQLVTLIDDLMDVSRITRGKFEMRMGRVELAGILQSAIEAVKPFIDQQGHKLITSFPREPVFLRADPNRLAQVVSNLLNNAAKYTRENGKIWLSAHQESEEQVVISVKDTGEGIPADMLDSIFEMFTQIDRSLERAHSGLGIGLTLAQSLVLMHHGTIKVYSEGLGKGTEVVVKLPILQSTAGAKADNVHEPSARHARTCRVLVVDDNRAAAHSLRTMLTILGHDVRTAHDGLEALEVAKAFRPELVLLDLGMPRMNGFETAARMRAEAWGKELMLVAVTGWGQKQDRERTASAGFDRHLVKPVEPDAIQSVLVELDRQRSGMDQ